MQGITITDRTADGFLAVNLIDILQAIAPSLSSTYPKCDRSSEKA
jgi:hypothetical protein